MRLLIIIIGLCGFLSQAKAQEIAPIDIIDSTGNVVLLWDDPYIKETSEKILYTVRGNLVFKGESDNRKDIVYLLKTNDIFSGREIGEVLDPSMKHVRFTINDGDFFLGKASIYNDNYRIASYEIEENTIELSSPVVNSPIALVKGSDISSAALFAIFVSFNDQMELDKKLVGRMKVEETFTEDVDLSESSGTIRRLWNTGNDEFVWDGQILKRKWQSFDYEEWTFDGYSLRRAWYSGDEEFVWDGHTMKRRWFNSRDEFEWDGSTLRRKWAPGEEYYIQGNIIKRTFDSSGEHEWEMEGDIPIPIIALVVFDLLRK